MLRLDGQSLKSRKHPEIRKRGDRSFVYVISAEDLTTREYAQDRGWATDDVMDCDCRLKLPGGKMLWVLRIRRNGL